MSLPALSPFLPLAAVLADVDRCIEAKLYYPALLVALTIPEICSALALDNSVFVKEKHYVSFINKYADINALGMDGLTCFRLRGGVVHRANAAGHPFLGATHVIFTIPETPGGMHAILLKMPSLKDGTDTLAAMFYLPFFCKEMVAAAYRWYEDHQNDAKVTENMNNLMRYLPNGLKPFVGGGIPIVASGSSIPLAVWPEAQRHIGSDDHSTSRKVL